MVAVQDVRIAVWLVSRTELHRADHTNAVVLDYENSETLASLIGDRLVLGENNLSPVAPHFDLGAVNRILDSTFELQDQIRRRWPALRLPVGPVDRSLEGPLVDHLLNPLPGDLPYKTLAIADCLRKVWSFWLATEQVRHRKVNQLLAADKGGDQAESLWPSTFAALPAEFLNATTASVTVDA